MPLQQFHPICALVLDLLDSLTGLELTLLLQLFLHLFKFLLVQGLIVVHLVGQCFNLRLGLSLKGDVVISCRPQIFMEVVQLFLQRDQL